MIIEMNEWLRRESAVDSILRAIERNDIPTIEALLESYCISPDEVIDEYTLLGYAAEKGGKEVTKFILGKGADINPLSDNPDVLTPLMSAVQGGNFEIVRMFIEAGADANEIRDAGRYPLLIAAEWRREDLFDYLLPFTTSGLIEEATNTLSKVREKLLREPLSEATLELFHLLSRSDSSKLKIIKAISKGADINAYDESDHTILMRACERFSDESIIKVLLDRGADPNIGNPNPLACAIASRHYSSDVIKLLINKGANVNHKFDSGLTLLMSSCIRNNKIGHDLCRILLEAGADYSIKDEFGRTALTYAVGNKNTEAARLLLEAGAIE
jgi:ankyrin repeat protein